MNRAVGAVRRAGQAAGETARRSPVEVALAVLLASVFSLAVERDSPELFQRALTVVVLALPVVFAATLLRLAGVISRRARWSVALAGVVSAILCAVSFGSLATSAELVRLALLFGALCAGFALLPLRVGLLGVDPREAFWLFNARLLARIVVVVASAAVLYGGLAGALAAVDALLRVTVRPESYAHLAGLLFFVAVPWAVAAGAPRLLAAGEVDRGAGPVAARLLGAYLLAPLTLAYVLILYAYMVRIGLTREVPVNLVSPLVLTSGALALLAGLVLEPLRAMRPASATAWFTRLAPIAMLPLAILGAWAVTVRVQQYGWTEFRYLRLVGVAVLAICAGLALMRLLRRAAPPLAALPAVVATALLLSAVGPWSATAVSRRSQTDRLAALVETRSLAPDQFEAAGDLARYLLHSHGAAALRPFEPATAEPISYDSIRHNAPALARAIGLREVLADAPFTLAARYPSGTGVAGLAGGTFYRVDLRSQRDETLPTANFGEVEVRLHPAEARVEVRRSGAGASADLGSLITSLLERMEWTPGATYGIEPGSPRRRVRNTRAEFTPEEAVIRLQGPQGQAWQLVLEGLSVHGMPSNEAAAADADTAGPARRTLLNGVTGYLIVP